MKKILISLFISFIIFCPLVIVGCEKTSNPNITLNGEQQQVYNEIESYASSCNSSQEKEELLYQIKLDIKQSSNDKLDIEYSIGKLRIDQLILKNKLESDISTKEQTALNNKRTYKKQRDSINNIYQGDLSSYNSQVLALQKKISESYITYYEECNRIDHSNMGDGYKTAYKEKARQKYQQESNSYSAEISKLKTQWQNKLNYEKYDKLYNEVDSTLQNDISKLQSTYQNDCLQIDNQINELIKQR